MELKPFIQIFLTIFILNLHQGVESCWGKFSNHYGVTTKDYSLLVGSTLVVNCTLNDNRVTLGSKEYTVNSSSLVFRKDFPDTVNHEYIHIVNSSTTQLRIPNATEAHSGTYYCYLDLSIHEMISKSEVNIPSAGPNGSYNIVNCTLNRSSFKIGNRQYTVNSSSIIFKTLEDEQPTHLGDVHIINTRTAQLRISNTTERNNVMCYVEIPVQEVICPTEVKIGYPPLPVAKDQFKCISKHFAILNCTWHPPPSKIDTTYTIYQVIYGHNIQMCPSPPTDPTIASPNAKYLINTCEWRDDTSPTYNRRARTFTFLLSGKNRLGSRNQTFTINHYEIVLPDRPQSLEAIPSETDMILRWYPPIDMQDEKTNPPPLFYQLQYRVNSNPSKEWTVVDIGVVMWMERVALTYMLKDLIPYTNYEIRLRCRSNATTKEDMWSTFIEVKQQTLPDVPYLVPEIIPQAFRNQYFKNSRSITLYWKPIPAEHWNGENFKYIVICAAINGCDLQMNVTSPTAVIGNLDSNVTYHFKIYSSNDQGFSKNYSTISVEKSEKLLNPVSGISAISLDSNQYNLSWEQSTSPSVTNYTVFWCANRNPLQLQCENAIQWTIIPSSNRSLLLKTSDSATYMFAVAAVSGNASSGMEWTLCVIPNMGALGKITDVSLEAKNTTSIKVMWKLRCKSQNAIVKKYQIAYCKVSTLKLCTGREIINDVLNPKAESAIIAGLSPSTRYRVVIRGYTITNQVSEDSEPQYLQTLIGAPSRPPSIDVMKVTNTSVFLSWKPLTTDSGKITRYVVLYNSQQQEFNDSDVLMKYNEELQGLKPYTNYTIEIKACIQEHCSLPSSAKVVRTDVGVPGEMSRPSFESINTTAVNISWNPPSTPNGPVSSYIFHVRRQEEGANGNGSTTAQMVIGNRSFMLYEMSCPLFQVDYFFSIQAVNIKGSAKLYGPISRERKIVCALNSSPPVSMFVGLAVGGTIGLAALVFVLYLLFTWMKKKVDLMKNIKVELPNGLQSPNVKTLNTYENFKSGLNRKSSDPHLSPRAVYGRLGSFTATDIDYKNRHGSGSSQFSTASTDELIYKTGRCAQFGRNPSGDSSGCSSGGHDSISSSNTTRTQLSTDSGTEHDMPSTLHPKVQQGETVQNNEVFSKNEAPESQVNSANPSSTKKAVTKQPSLLSGVVLDVKPMCNNSFAPGVDSYPPFLKWDRHPLVFYSRNLAVSEPSFADISRPENHNGDSKGALAAPYSRFGLAKSVGEVNSFGYSKFGMVTTMYPDTEKALQENIKSKFYQDVPNSPFLRQGYVTVGSAMEQPKTVFSQFQKTSENPVFSDDKQINILPSSRYTLPGGTTNNGVPSKGIPTEMYSRFGLIHPPQSKGYIPLDHIKNMTATGKSIHASQSDDADYSLLDISENAVEENKNEFSSEILGSTSHTTETGPSSFPLLLYNSTKPHLPDKCATLVPSLSTPFSANGEETQLSGASLSDENHNNLLSAPDESSSVLSSLTDSEFIEKDGDFPSISQTMLVNSSGVLSAGGAPSCGPVSQGASTYDNLDEFNALVKPQHSISPLSQCDSLKVKYDISHGPPDCNISDGLHQAKSPCESQPSLHMKKNGYISHNDISNLFRGSLGGKDNYQRDGNESFPSVPSECSPVCSTFSPTINKNTVSNIPEVSEKKSVPPPKNISNGYVPQCKVVAGFAGKTEKDSNGYIPFVRPKNFLNHNVQPESRGFVTLVPEPDTEVCEV